MATSGSGDPLWLQAEFESHRLLKCVRVPLASTKVTKNKNFNGIEFRFGNYSKIDGFSKNLKVAYAENGRPGSVFEFCLGYHLVGKYLILHKKASVNETIRIGEIQITAD